LKGDQFMPIAEILRRLRRQPGEPETAAEPDASPPDPAADAEAARTALADLDRERDRLRAELADAQARRRQALLDDLPDDQVAAIDRQIDRLHLGLERLDTLEPELVAAVKGSQHESRAQGLAEIVRAYQAAVDGFGRTMMAAAEMRATIIRLREFAANGGYEGFLPSLEVPRREFPLDPEAIVRFAAGAAQTAQAILLPATPPPVLFPVTFVKSAGSYRIGETAGFTAAEAHAWVRSGNARWAPGVRPPPLPAHMKRQDEEVANA
jgi:hypothetical protein